MSTDTDLYLNHGSGNQLIVLSVFSFRNLLHVKPSIFRLTPNCFAMKRIQRIP